MRRARRNPTEGIFKCVQCRRFIAPVPSGGQHRNHCPFCLHSRHVDAGQSGDRLNACGARMAPIGAFQRPSGEHVVVHRCLGCGFERFNRIAADDDFALVLTLPEVPPRTRRMETASPRMDGGILMDFPSDTTEEECQNDDKDILAG
ncbi:MAG: RNHCP domain-containing protein [Ktedonobacterales bacterium]|nr:RNHCP domain-containing protein [Ktedonobacterales bacterium]